LSAYRTKRALSNFEREKPAGALVGSLAQRGCSIERDDVAYNFPVRVAPPCRLLLVSFRPTRIPGRWRDGFALDYHTVSNTYVGDDQFGHPQFDTKRSDLGELLYQLKYHGDASALPKLIEVAGLFVRSWNPSVELIVPVPPSRARRVQPVLLLAGGLSENLGIAYDPDCVSKTRDVPELKNVYEYDERLRLLEGAHIVDR